MKTLTRISKLHAKLKLLIISCAYGKTDKTTVKYSFEYKNNGTTECFYKSIAYCGLIKNYKEEV